MSQVWRWIAALGLLGAVAASALALRGCEERAARSEAVAPFVEGEAEPKREAVLATLDEDSDVRDPVEPGPSGSMTLAGVRVSHHDEPPFGSGGSVVGTVVDNHGNAVAGAWVAVYDTPIARGSSPATSVESDATGKFAVSPRPYGQTVLLVAAPPSRAELLPRTIHVPSFALMFDELDLGVVQLERGQTVSGTIDRRALEMAGARPLRVEAGLGHHPLSDRFHRGADRFSWSGEEFHCVYKAAECEGGRFELVGLVAEEYGLRIHPSCYPIDSDLPVWDVAASEPSVHVTAPAEDVFVPLSYGPTSVRVSSGGSPVAHAKLHASWAWVSSGGGGEGWSPTDEEGRHTFLLPDGLELDLTAAQVGYFPNATTIRQNGLDQGRVSIELTEDPTPIEDPWPSAQKGEALIRRQRLQARTGADEALGLWVLEYDGRMIDPGLETALEQMAADGPGFHWRNDPPTLATVVMRRTAEGDVRLYGMPTGDYVAVAATLSTNEAGEPRVERVGERLRFVVQPRQTTIVR